MALLLDVLTDSLSNNRASGCGTQDARFAVGFHAGQLMEAAEDKLAASGAHGMVELFIVFTHPAKNEDPRAPGRQTNFAHNTK